MDVQSTAPVADRPGSLRRGFSATGHIDRTEDGTCNLTEDNILSDIASHGFKRTAEEYGVPDRWLPPTGYRPRFSP